jgi:hypothetical protein
MAEMHEAGKGNLKKKELKLSKSCVNFDRFTYVALTWFHIRIMFPTEANFRIKVIF